ncbi:putative glucose-6-phosphate 1-epimerase [Solanum dulcamara]|uniref:putative glucose-6-phosphate 1-epimerase n=1 Tax=Solanum dulcamara TaxID=45834 RepID=UPI0024861F86|nr:putative glucose-6-phosphate 1-epimerase [Solanum dulcamara]
MKRSGTDKDYKAKEIVKDKNGIDQIYLRNRRGFSVQVSLNGGQVLSWKTDRNEELLFISRRATPTAVMGGIHIRFPEFGNGSALEKHGFSRNRMWVIDNNPPPLQSNHSNDKTYIDLLAELSTGPHNFEFRLRVALALDGSLALTSRIRNISSKNFSFYIAHQTYFSVSDISYCSVDRVYLSSVGQIQVVAHNPMNKRTFLIKKEVLPDVVVWNPWKERSNATADLGAEEYKHMVCVGSAAIEKPIPLKPGEEWTGKLELSFKQSS